MFNHIYIYRYIYNTSGTFSVETMFFYFQRFITFPWFQNRCKGDSASLHQNAPGMSMAGWRWSMVIPSVRHRAIGSQPVDWDAKFVCVSHISTGTPLELGSWASRNSGCCFFSGCHFLGGFPDEWWGSWDASILHLRMVWWRIRNRRNMKKPSKTHQQPINIYIYR